MYPYVLYVYTAGIVRHIRTKPIGYSSVCRFVSTDLHLFLLLLFHLLFLLCSGIGEAEKKSSSKNTEGRKQEARTATSIFFQNDVV
jgi:hypothetical protein